MPKGAGLFIGEISDLTYGKEAHKICDVLRMIGRRDRNMSMKNKDRRILAVILGIFIMFALFGSSFFIATEVHHHCCEEECPVCDSIKQCQNTLKTLADGALACIVFVAAFYSVVSTITVFTADFAHKTPVSFKVRMND